MTVLRVFAIILIFGIVAAAWWILAGTTLYRTHRLDQDLSREVRSLWGPEVLVQTSPYAAATGDAERDDAQSVAPSSSTITAEIAHDNRYKGLLWFSTFAVTFDATYEFNATTSGEGLGPSMQVCVFWLPRGAIGYDSLSIELNGSPYAVTDGEIASGRILVPISRAKNNRLQVHYVTNGQDIWLYSPAGVHVSGSGLWESDDFDAGVLQSGETLVSLPAFSLTVQTDFEDIDYPKGSRSPNEPAGKTDGGMAARWQFNDAVTNQAMGIAMPQRLNAGPIVTRMSFFAPVTLFFFFTVLMTIVILKKIPLHPMHYLFIAAAFFAFHILLAYLADKVSIHTGFWICAVVSMLLVVSYIRLVAGVKFAVVYVGAAQLVYLLGFSYAFFFPGWTGLTVVVGAVVTLFVLMQATGKVDWARAFSRRRPAQQAIPPVPARPDQTGQ